LEAISGGDRPFDGSGGLFRSVGESVLQQGGAAAFKMVGNWPPSFDLTGAGNKHAGERQANYQKQKKVFHGGKFAKLSSSVN
jgi:hypothetical protein